MSYCRQEGKDKVIFLTKDDYEREPPKVDLPEYEGEPGLFLPNGQINWNCPCLGGMATGPCGFEFREAFTCVTNSKAENKGSDCIEKFQAMQECFLKYPSLYGSGDDDNVGGADDGSKVDVFEQAAAGPEKNSENVKT